MGARLMAVLVAVFMALGGTAVAENWQEPARASKTRSDIMNAIRPHAEWMLGAPVEFVVQDLREARGIAFASLLPQRPGGGVIDPADTPMVRLFGGDPYSMDGVAMQALLVRSGTVWVALHWEIGATDAWWADPMLCARFARVTPRACGF